MAIDAGPGASNEGSAGLPVMIDPAAPASASDRAGPPRGPAVRFYVAVCLSLYGDWLTTVALLVVLFEVTHTPAAPAGYMVARIAPRVAGPWLGGHLADRFSPRVVMMSTAAVQGVLTAALIWSHRAGLIWAIYAVVALAQFAGALGRPSHGALIPTLVRERELPRANATYWLLFSTSIFVAPAIGALLLGRVGPDLLFAIDAATFAICALLIATLPAVRPPALAIGRSGSGRRGEGALREALRQPGVRIVAAANFASGLAITVTQALLVVAAHERFGGDAAVGYLYSSVGIGGALGGLIALRWIPSRAWTRLAVFLAITTQLVALAAFSGSTVPLLALSLLGISTLAGSSFDTWGATEIQRSAPPGYMGRYNSVIFIALNAGMFVGALWALATANSLHWDVAVEAACAAMLILVGVVWIWGGRPSSLPIEGELAPDGPPVGAVVGAPPAAPE